MSTGRPTGNEYWSIIDCIAVTSMGTGTGYEYGNLVCGWTSTPDMARKFRIREETSEYGKITIRKEV